MTRGGAAVARAGAACLVLLAAATAASAPNDPAPKNPAEKDPAERNAAQRAAMEAYFRDNAFSPLRAFRRYDFPPDGGAGAGGDARGNDAGAIVGSSPDAQVRLQGPGVEPRQMRVVVLPPETEDGPARFRLERLAPGGEVKIDGRTWAPDDGTARIVPEETPVEIGPFALRPYVQAGGGILILFDSRRTAAGTFVPPAWFAFDRAWVFHARLVRDPRPERLAVPTSLGRTKEYVRAGSFTIDAPGRAGLKVNAYRPTFIANAASSLSILFTDATSGKETYGAGRYLDLDPPADGVYTLDFNRSYNPLCAYTSVYNCPIPPAENALPVAVRAGEKTWPGRAAH